MSDLLPSIRAPAPRAPQVHLVDLDGCGRELLGQWLAEAGWEVWAGASNGPGRAAGPDLLIVAVGFARRGAAARVAEMTALWPGARIVIVSPTVTAGTPAQGQLARQLGVAAVLAVPLVRSGLLSVATRLDPRRVLASP